ncbi:hypothetical protein [Xanthobacter sp. KR7-225]|uniref:hypothetical protein n=1 Tax=Xanthobacter sp. KR7-225 TaxID=3156613 RepID=UPI0032B58079
MSTAHLSPLQVTRDGSTLVLRTMGEAVDFIRTLPVAGHAGMLIDVMEAADEPELERRAWRAFETFASAMRIPVHSAGP